MKMKDCSSGLTYELTGDRAAKIYEAQTYFPEWPGIVISYELISVLISTIHSGLESVTYTDV